MKTRTVYNTPPSVVKACDALLRELRAAYGVDFSFRIVRRGETIAEHSARAVVMPSAAFGPADAAPAKFANILEEYAALKAGQAPGTIVLLRLGDFYEVIGDDAARVAAVLGVTLTRRKDSPMCGFPYHAAETYLTKLRALGVPLAVADPGKAGLDVRFISPEVSA